MFSAPTAEVTKLAEVYFNHASWQLTQEDGQLAIADVTFTNFRYNFLFTPFVRLVTSDMKIKALIGHFRVPKTLTFKKRLSAKTFLSK